MRTSFLRFQQPTIGKEEEAAVLEVLRSGWLTTGPKALQFEAEFAALIGCGHAVSVSSCTAALHLALVALGIGRGDEVITTPVTWPATVNVILQQGATPVFVDVEEDTLNLDAGLVENAITTRTKAILPVHIAGHPCDMDRINRVARSYKLSVIEDAAHAVGTSYKGRKAGTLGDAGCFSLYPTKNITSGEGGMLTTDSDKIVEIARTCSFSGIDRSAWNRYSSSGYRHWEVVRLGYKYNMPDILAAIGIEQLKKLPVFQARRKRISELYDRLLADAPGVKLPVRKPYAGHGYHLYIIQVQPPASRDGVIVALQAQNIGIGVHFRALHLQLGYQSLGYRRGTLPVAERVSERVLSLPLYPYMTVEDVTDVVEAVRSAVSPC